MTTTSQQTDQITDQITELIDLHPPAADMEQLVRIGLNRSPRQLPAWFLYDEQGSRLFDRICQQPEYSLTRTEIALLKSSAPEIAAAIGEGVIVEFGAGSAQKVGPLLDAVNPVALRRRLAPRGRLAPREYNNTTLVARARNSPLIRSKRVGQAFNLLL